MGFLYPSPRVHLEKIPAGCQFIGHGGPNPNALDAHQHPAVWACKDYAAIPFAWSMQMMDVIMVALGLAFFAVSVGYTMACDRL
jgi:hypothetical protein